MTETLELTAPTTSAVAALSLPVDVDKLDTAKPLVEIFAPYQTTLEKWEAKAKSLIVSDIGQVAEMKMARVARLELRAARIGMDKTRLGLVENLKARTSKIDGTARIIREKIEGLEAILLESEEFAERHAEKVKSELKVKRESELLPFLDSPLVVDLSDMTERGFVETLNAHKVARQAKIDAAAKAEADRLAKEAADMAERERIVAENARLKAEAEETARLAEIERKERERFNAEQKAEADAEWRRIEDERQAERDRAEAEKLLAFARARKEREAIQAKAVEAARMAHEANEKLRAELEAKAKAEAVEKARIEAERVEKEQEARRAAAAPDKAKLQAYSNSILAVDLPALSNVKLFTDLKIKRNMLTAWIESNIDTELI